MWMLGFMSYFMSKLQNTAQAGYKQGHQTSDNIGFSIDVLPLTQMTQHPPTIITLGSKKAFMWSLGSFWCGF